MKVSWSGVTAGSPREQRLLADYERDQVAGVAWERLARERDAEDITSEEKFATTLRTGDGEPRPYEEQLARLEERARELRATADALIAQRTATATALADLRAAVETAREDKEAELHSTTAQAIAHALSESTGSSVKKFFEILAGKKRPLAMSHDELEAALRRIALEGARLESPEAIDLERRSLAKAERAQHDLDEHLAVGSTHRFVLALLRIEPELIAYSEVSNWRVPHALTLCPDLLDRFWSLAGGPKRGQIYVDGGRERQLEIFTQHGLGSPLAPNGE